MKNPNFTFDDIGLFCDEQEPDLDFGFFDQKSQFLKQKDDIFYFQDYDILWEKDEIFTLLSKEKNVGLIGNNNNINNNVALMGLRKESIDWIVRVSTHFGFLAVTTILAVNCFDRFLLSPSFQFDKPWMNQLIAVTCLSLASKVEEIQARLLIDLQLEGSKFVFESKTIMKMELLVLSSLQWKMNPVTPLSFIDYIMRRLGLITHYRYSEMVRRCEKLLLAVINDSRSLLYLPSVMAAATMILVMKEVDPDNAFDYQNQLKGFLEICKVELDDCSKLILEVLDNHETGYLTTHKRKYQCAPGSPNGVIDLYFSSDNSCDSWAVTSSVSSSPEPALKKMRAQNQQMRLAPVSCVSLNDNL